MSSRQEEKERRRQQRVAAEQAQRRAATHRRRLQLAAGAAVLIAAAVVVVVLITGGGGGSHPTASTSTPATSQLLATTKGEASGATVDGIQCQSTEQALFHIHAHLAVYVNGRPALVPEGVGIPGAQVQQTADGPFASPSSCLYWLHSHTRDGVIHIESPVQRTFTLGNYFDIWKQPLRADEVGPAKGHVTEYVNGKRYSGAPASIPLNAHELIQLDLGRPAVKPQPYTFAQGL